MADGEGKVVLITGASSGIGEATALYLAERGYSVIGTSRSADRLAPLKRETSSRGLSLTAAEMNINSDSGVEEALGRFEGEQGEVDVLVNNAGYGLWGPVGSLSIEELKTQFETNFFAAFRLIKAVLPGMLERRRGTIINVSSVAGRLAVPFSGGYAASKFALEGLSEALRVELWPLGVRVALVEPGLFRTNFPKSQVVAGQANSSDLSYGPYIDRYKARRGRYDLFSSDPIKVAKVIHKIIRSRRPRFRYPVGVEVTLGVLGAKFLPERLFQSLLSRATMG